MDGATPPKEIEKVIESFFLLVEVTSDLRAQRMNRGVISLERPDKEFSGSHKHTRLNGRTGQLELTFVRKNLSAWIIEELMNLANSYVASRLVEFVKSRNGSEDSGICTLSLVLSGNVWLLLWFFLIHIEDVHVCVDNEWEKIRGCRYRSSNVSSFVQMSLF